MHLNQFNYIQRELLLCVLTGLLQTGNRILRDKLVLLNAVFKMNSSKKKGQVEISTAEP